MKEELNQVPIQVVHLIDSLRDKNERVHIRGNYRQRLDSIRTVIDRALSEYDAEMSGGPSPKFKRGKQ